MKIICIGQATYDITLPVPKSLSKDSKIKIDKQYKTYGGSAYNAASLLSKWGKEVYFAGAVAIILLVLFVILIIKYKSKGLLASISCVGFIALLSLVLRYTNVIITIEGIGAIILVILIDLKLSQMMLNKTKILNVVSEAVKSSYKELFLKLVPIMIASIVFCFSGWTNLSSFGMIMFWGFILIAVYNIIVTKTLLKLRENK